MATTEPSTTQISVPGVPDEHRRALEALAAKNERTLAQELRFAIRRHVEAEQEQAA